MKETIILENISITSLLKAYESFKKAVSNAQTELERDGALQRFEFTYELLWRSLKKILSFKGIKVNSPREVFRAAVNENLIDDLEFWFDALKKRNETTHTYDEDLSIEVYDFLPKYEEELTKVINTIKKL